MVNAATRSNLKYINTTLGGGLTATSVINSAPVITLLNGVAPGTTENTRIGAQCRLKWLDLNLHIAVGNLADCFGVRAYVVVETSALGSALAAAQFFVDAASFTHMSQRDLTGRNASRYCVLWDSGPMILGGLPTASATSVVLGAGQPAAFAIAKRIALNFDTNYCRGIAGTIADIDTNSMHLVVVTENTTVNGVAAEATWTVAFSDI